MFNINNVIILYDGSTNEEEVLNKTNALILSKSGMLVRKKQGILDYLIPVSNIPELSQIECFAKFNIEKIPISIFSIIISFLKEVNDKKHCECTILLDYNEELRKYKLYVPKQKCSFASSDSIEAEIPESGYTRLGTVHSHPTFGASHSSIDIGDENNESGLHITIGDLPDLPVISISASIVIKGFRKKVNPCDYIEGIQEFKENEEEKKKIHSNFCYIYTSSSTNKYMINIPKSKLSHPKEWIDLVEVNPIVYSFKGKNHTYSNYFYNHGIVFGDKNKEKNILLLENKKVEGNLVEKNLSENKKVEENHVLPEICQECIYRKLFLDDDNEIINEDINEDMFLFSGE